MADGPARRRVEGMHRTHSQLFKELRKRNQRRARVARMLESRHHRSPEIARIVDLHRKHRKVT